MGFQIVSLLIVGVIVAVCNSKPEPQYFHNPYNYGGYHVGPRYPVAHAPVQEPRLFGALGLSTLLNSVIKPLFTYTYSTTTSTTTATVTTTSTCTTSTATLQPCTTTSSDPGRRRRFTDIIDVEEPFILPSSVKNTVQKTPVHSLTDGIRQSRQSNPTLAGVYYTFDDLSNDDQILASVNSERTINIISYYVSTVTQSTTSTVTAKATLTATCSSVTGYSAC